MKVFKRKIHNSQANYFLEIVPNLETKVQGSYNLDKELKSYLEDHNALVVSDMKPFNENHFLYSLSPDWKFKIDESVLSIIGEEYKNLDNQIIFASTKDRHSRSEKFQLMKTYFKETNKKEYEWFPKLYDHNIVGSEISIEVWEEKNEIIIITTIQSYKELVQTMIDKKVNSSIDFLKGGKNEIYYDSPGSGKSYFVKQHYEKDESIFFRTTFHPEYTNSDFVGQIIPTLDSDNEVVYKFSPGTFTIALINALNNPDRSVILIIEEINRGNAAAIFGDIFQLLDRNSDGRSIYSINNENLVFYINKERSYKIDKIFIPSNLSIVATMNTSDQNVYPLDTAFKRRWNLIKIKNDFSNNNHLANLFVPSTDTTWKKFVTTINSYIVNNPEKLNIFGEDKTIGVYFVSKNELSNIANDESDDGVKTNKLFAEKVLFYIWNDIAKLSPLFWFESEYKTFDSVLEGFAEKGLDIFVEGIFK
ncbi:AAA family ATPase [Mycoplasmopsis agassizii]|uniref:ATPase dynein-related AAA domain-containing protein n=1 Tax=Mycoplasmopsis agassizii TaxID=33922 RepID=A0ABX4H5B3_9BACT|nr:AAA family ATPase [Mycoplasmopsis agassizii]PAF55086.1 hypothetical protein CJF60_00135 [Mycoplasmopsis agassizii]SMC19155.1 AAA domain (dynein-related subfamily) [Mycoplasmopsis agassizii]